jgi:plastocyanin
MIRRGKTRHTPSTSHNIPASDLGNSPFDPSVVSIPAGMSVIWFNDDDQSEHSVTFNDTSPEAIDSATIAPGGFFIHEFSTPGIYDYYDGENPASKGRINVGNEFERGQNMDMLVGGNALPFNPSNNLSRVTLSFVPKDNATTIPPTLSITYNVTIANSTAVLYNNQFEESDGILDLELVPVRNANSIRPFVTWGPDLTDQEGVASDGTYHVRGPVLVDNDIYTVQVAIVEVDNQNLSSPIQDEFLLPSGNALRGNNMTQSE